MFYLQQFYYQLRCSHEFNVHKKYSGSWSTSNSFHVSRNSLSPTCSMTELTSSSNSHPRISLHSISPNNSISESPLEMQRNFSGQFSLRYLCNQASSISPPVTICAITQDAWTQTEADITNKHAEIKRSISQDEHTTNSRTLSRSSHSLNKIHEVSNKLSRRSKSMKLIKV